MDRLQTLQVSPTKTRITVPAFSYFSNTVKLVGNTPPVRLPFHSVTPAAENPACVLSSVCSTVSAKLGKIKSLDEKLIGRPIGGVINGERQVRTCAAILFIP